METIWFILWILLWAVYFVLDGFDLGMGTLMPFLASNDYERRVIYNAQGPYWDGNEVWLITAGGATFAAFPDAYAVMFSALYAPLLILLFCLIFLNGLFSITGMSMRCIMLFLVFSVVTEPVLRYLRIFIAFLNRLYQNLKQRASDALEESNNIYDE